MDSNPWAGVTISVITVSFNSSATIVNAVESVLSQEAVELEYIVIDGDSTDGTVALLEEYSGKIAHLVSEPDEGIYDAMNKGIECATGDIIAILNSDDFYPNSSVLARVAKAFQSEDVGCVFGDLDYVDAQETNRVVRAWRSKPYEAGAFRKGWHPAHPAFFVRRSVYEKIGLFNTQLKIAADYEFMLRSLQKNSMTAKYIPEVLVKMRNGGKSNQSVWNVLSANKECVLAWRLNGFSWHVALWAVIRKPFYKLKQFVSA